MMLVLNPFKSFPPSAPGGSITLNELSRDRVIYDSGAAFGRDYADIPFAGTAPVGQIVQGRVYSLDDGGVTSSAWVDIATADLSGNYSGSLSAVLNESYYRKEVRLKASPLIGAQATNRLAVGHVHAIWGQSEPHRINQTSFSNTAAETLLAISEQVDRLVLLTMTGRNSTNALKVAGVDALPGGASLSGRTITITGNVTLEDWQIDDYQVQVANGGRLKLRQSILREVVGGLAPNYLLQVMKGGRCDTQRVTMYAPGGTPLSALIREEGSGGGATYGKSTHKRLRVTNFPADFAKVVSAEFYDCYIASKQNLKKVPTLYNGATSYAIDDYVYTVNGGNINAYAALQAGTLPTPPVDGSNQGVSNAYWSSKAPHSDGINPTETCEKIIVRRCVVDFSLANIANGSVGITSNIRCETTAGSYILTGGIEISYSVLDRDPASPQWPITITGGFTTNVQIERSRFTPRGSDGRVITVGTATVTWADNTVKASGAAIATPSGCVGGSSTLKTNDEVVQVVFHDRTNAGMLGVQHRFISTAAPYTAAISSMANTYLAERPGEKVCILFHTLSGTGFSELFNDGAVARSWADDFAVHQYGASDGVHVGVTSSTWYASPIGLGTYYGEAFHQLVTGKDSAGVALNVNGSGQRLVLEAGRTLPDGGTVSGQQIVCDHLWADIYDYTKTKWLLWGPHRFEINADMTDAIHLRAGGTDNQLSLAQSCRSSVKSMLAKPAVVAENIFLPVPFDPLGYSNGKSNGAGGWTDTAHPSDNSPDGLMRWGRLHAHAMMMAAGLTRFQTPVYDQCAWAADGSMVEMWSSLGPISTTRLKRGDAALGATFNHWGDVFGWQLDGAPAKASIVAGRTRIVPPAGAFDNWTNIKFGEGGATGQIEVPEDFINLCYKNWPLIDVGAYGLEGLPMSALPLAAVLANTIAGAAMFTSVAGQLSYLKDSANWPTGAAGQKLTLYFDGRLTNTGGTQVLASMEGSPHLTLDCTSAGALRLTVKDSAGGAVMTTVALGTIAFGVRFKLTVSFDISTTNACYSTLNGVATQRNFTGTANGLASASRKFRFLTSASAANFSIGDFGELAVWNDYQSGGGNPADTNLRFRVTGPAASANSPTGCTLNGGNFV